MGINTIEIFPGRKMVVVEDFVGGGFYLGLDAGYAVDYI